MTNSRHSSPSASSRAGGAKARRENQAAEKRLSLREVRAAMLAKLASEFAGDDAIDDDALFEDDLLDDELTEASNAVLALIRDGKLDEAEVAARALLAQYPDVHDGWDRLGMVHEARGENVEAADCYRNVVAFLDQNPDYSEPAFKDAFVERIAKLAPPADG